MQQKHVPRRKMTSVGCWHLRCSATDEYSTESQMPRPHNKWWSEKSSEMTVDGDGHRSKEKASVTRPHLHNARWLAVKRRWCWGWWKVRQWGQPAWRWIDDVLMWCDKDIKGAVMMTEVRDNWRRFLSTSHIWSPWPQDLNKKNFLLFLTSIHLTHLSHDSPMFPSNKGPSAYGFWFLILVCNLDNWG